MPKQRNSPEVKTSAKGVKYMDVEEYVSSDPYEGTVKTRKSTRTMKDMNKPPKRKSKNQEYTF